MQDHPPLGKLLVAAGEALFRVNDEADDALFVSTPVAHDPPESLSFLGYRFFPALLAWWAAPIFFVVFLTLTGRRRLALLLSAFYLFDNALIVHVRTAMLDGPMIFFAAAAILIFVLLDARPERAARLGWAALFGVTLGLLAATKEPAMILGGLAPFAAWRLRPRWRAAAAFLGIVLAASAAAYTGVWEAHFAIARRVNPALPNGGYFEASPAVRAALDEGRTGSIGMLPAELRNIWTYEAGVNRGIPALDMCSATENGSPPYYWPLGGRAINYRMETGDGHTFRYAYLQANPVVWWLGFLAVVTGTGLVLASPWVPRLRAWPHRDLVAAFAALYLDLHDRAEPDAPRALPLLLLPATPLHVRHRGRAGRGCREPGGRVVDPRPAHGRALRRDRRHRRRVRVLLAADVLPAAVRGTVREAGARGDLGSDVRVVRKARAATRVPALALNGIARRKADVHVRRSTTSSGRCCRSPCMIPCRTSGSR